MKKARWSRRAFVTCFWLSGVAGGSDERNLGEGLAVDEHVGRAVGGHHAWRDSTASRSALGDRAVRNRAVGDGAVCDAARGDRAVLDRAGADDVADLVILSALSERRQPPSYWYAPKLHPLNSKVDFFRAAGDHFFGGHMA